MPNSSFLEKTNLRFAECSLCGERIQPDEASMFIHLLQYHPAELLASNHMQNMLSSLSIRIESFFESVGKRIAEEFRK
jgi:hypothetical protein